MGLLNKKARRDLFGNRSRILTVILAMVLGTTVFGTFTFTSEIINREIEAEFSSTVPASASILVDRVDDELLQLIGNFREISAYEIGSTHELMMVRPNGTMKKLQLFSSPSFEKRTINIITSVKGSFSPGAGEVLVESDAMDVAGAKLGDNMTIQLSDGTLQQYRISGLVNDLSQHPASIHDEVYAYVSPDTLTEMGLSMNRIDYLITGNAYDRTQILNVSESFIRLLQDFGYHVEAVNVSNTPGVSIHRDEYKGALFIFQAFSVVAFLFGCIIMSSLFGTILSGQVRQIGVLKSMGTRTSKIICSYMRAAALLIICNVAVSLPLSYMAACGLSTFFMSIGNMIVHNFTVPGYLFLIFCVVGVIVPFILVLIPIRRGLSITVKEAVSDSGVSVCRVKKDKITGVLEKKVSRPILFSLRGAMENKRRFAMNVIMLTLGGIMFVGVMGATISINTALSKSMDAWQYDYQIITGLNTDKETLKTAVETCENVSDYEIWGAASGQIIYAGGNTGNTFSFSAVPENAAFYKPDLMKGRWLQEGDTNAIVVSFEFLKQEPDYELGSSVSFRFGDDIRELQIVGIIYEIGQSSIYMSQSGCELLVPEYAQRNCINIVTRHTNGHRSAQYNRISEHISKKGVSILQAVTKTDKQKILSGHFTTTLLAFLIVAFLAVVVAGFGLATTMKVQVKERTREIGILKAIGANARQVSSIISAESIYTCLFSFIFCLLLSIPFSVLAIQIIGVSILEIPLTISPFSIAASLVIWFIFILIVGRLASRKAAKQAAGLTVKTAFVIE